MHGTVCNYTLIYAHLNGIYQGWGVIATMNGKVYQPPWAFRPSCYARRLPIDTCLETKKKKIYKSPLTNYVFGVAMGGLLLKLQNFKKVKLIFGHPVLRIPPGRDVPSTLCKAPYNHNDYSFVEILASIIELFETKYQRALLKADMTIFEQMDLTSTQVRQNCLLFY